MNQPAQEAIRSVYEQAEVGMREVRSALHAELWAAELLGALRLGAGPVPPEVTASLTSAFVAALADEAERVGDATALAMLRALGALVPAPDRDRLASIAARLSARGLPVPAWASTVGAPTIGVCLRHGGVGGEQESVLVSARYNGEDHVLVVLIDHVLGGGVKDCWVAENGAEITARFRRASREPGMTGETLTWPQARQVLAEAVSRPECPEQPDQVRDVATHRAILLARLARDDDAAGAPSSPDGH